jgi:hypothetical protein
MAAKSPKTPKNASVASRSAASSSGAKKARRTPRQGTWSSPRERKLKYASFAGMQDRSAKLSEREKYENSAFTPGKKLKGKGSLNFKRSLKLVY